MRKLLKPTDAELGILRVLWTRGPSTVRQVHDTLNEERPTGYTTALKLLQIMADKGLVRRNEASRSHVYEAAASEDDTQRQLVGDLLDRAFDGAAGKLVLRALEDGKVTPDELAEIRRILNKRSSQ